jgi:hypothetical protein
MTMEADACPSQSQASELMSLAQARFSRLSEAEKKLLRRAARGDGVVQCEPS